MSVVPRLFASPLTGASDSDSHKGATNTNSLAANLSKSSRPFTSASCVTAANHVPRRVRRTVCSSVHQTVPKLHGCYHQARQHTSTFFGSRAQPQPSMSGPSPQVRPCSQLNSSTHAAGPAGRATSSLTLTAPHQTLCITTIMLPESEPLSASLLSTLFGALCTANIQVVRLIPWIKTGPLCCLQARAAAAACSGASCGCSAAAGKQPCTFSSLRQRHDSCRWG